MSLLKRLGVVSVPVTDYAKAKAFYHETLGLPIAFDGGAEMGWCEFGGQDRTSTLAISVWTEGTPPRGGAVPIFDVDDCAAAVAELRKRGVKAEDAVTIPGMVVYATAYDHEGNKFQMAQSLVPPGA
jgi:predicted enzyme related to lactoylglutathione lyase